MKKNKLCVCVEKNNDNMIMMMMMMIECNTYLHHPNKNKFKTFPSYFLLTVKS